MQMIAYRGLFGRWIGGFVGLQLARTLMSALGEVPILELAAKARSEHQFAQVGRRRRHLRYQFRQSQVLAAAVVVDHEMPTRWNQLSQLPDDAGFKPTFAGVDYAATPEFDLGKNAAFNPLLHSTPATAYNRGHEAARRQLALWVG